MMVQTLKGDMDHSRTLSIVLDHVHSGRARTRPALVRETDLGRSIVNQRIEDAIAAGLLEESDEEISTGGRPTRTLRLQKDRGAILAVVFGASRVSIELNDLRGGVLAQFWTTWDINAGPEESLKFLHDVGTRLLHETAAPLWAVAIGVPGPVDVRSGRTVHPPIMNGWHDYPIRHTLEELFRVPVFVDNDVNLMALGAWHATGRHDSHVLFVKAGTGIGAGIITNRQIVRGARGAAGDFGHTTITEDSRVKCRCGNYGCLEALAGGWALARDAYTAAFSRNSEYLQALISETGRVDPLQIARGVTIGDDVCTDLIHRSGNLLGSSIATIISILNPSTVYIGGSLSEAGEALIDAIRDQIEQRVLPLASDRLRIEIISEQHREGVIGAYAFAVESLLEPSVLARWFHRGDPREISASDSIEDGPTAIPEPTDVVESVTY